MGGLDFTAIDLVLANPDARSVCGVGLVRVRDGTIVDKSGGPVRPPQGLDKFNERQAEYTGVTADIAADAPPWPRVAEWIASYIGTDLLVAHNASWDVGMMQAACDAVDVPWPRFRFLCTMTLARSALRLPSYRLAFVADACGVTLDGLHRPLIEARGAALVAVELARRQGADTLDALADSIGVRPGSLEPGEYVRCTGQPLPRLPGKKKPVSKPAKQRPVASPSGQRRAPLPDPNPDADPEHSFYGKVIVFTGTLESRTREQAWNDVSAVGGVPERDVTKKTNILVVGDLDPRRFVPGAITSKKAARAFDLQKSGQDIEVMTEEDFQQQL